MESRRLVIAPITPQDYPEAAEVYRHSRRFLVEISGEKAEGLGPGLLEREVAEAGAHGALFNSIRLKNNGRMVGIVVYEPSGHDGQPSQAWLAVLMIAEPLQRQGYGVEAYKSIEDAIFENPEVRSIRLGVLENNPSAFRFWSRMGYRDTGGRKPGGRGHEVIVMEKRRSRPGSTRPQ